MDKNPAIERSIVLCCRQMKPNDALSSADRLLIARNLRLLRRLQGLTQIQLAAKAGVEVASVYRTEKGAPTRKQTLLKLSKAVETDFHALLEPNSKLLKKPWFLTESEDLAWHSVGDRRPVQPPENQQLIQNSDERLRLGRVGLVTLFWSHMKLFGPGPNISLNELFGKFTEGINRPIDKEAFIYCIRGDIRVTLGEEPIELRSGATLLLDNSIEYCMEPTQAVGPQGLPPLFLWVGLRR